MVYFPTLMLFPPEYWAGVLEGAPAPFAPSARERWKNGHLADAPRPASGYARYQDASARIRAVPGVAGGGSPGGAVAVWSSVLGIVRADSLHDRFGAAVN